MWAVALAMFVLQGSWLIAGGSVGMYTTAGLLACAGVVVTFGRIGWVNAIARVVFALLFAGSVADRFGWLGGPGADGVSWGNYTAFVDYTASLLPVDGLASAAALAATVVECALVIVLTVGQLSGRVTRWADLVAAATFTVFAVAMWTSVGFAEMQSYGVLVYAATAATLAAPARGVPWRTRQPRGRSAVVGTSGAGIQAPV